MNWMTYAYGYKSREAAEDAMMDEVSEGRLTLRDCRVEAYTTTAGVRRWRILEAA